MENVISEGVRVRDLAPQERYVLKKFVRERLARAELRRKFAKLKREPKSRWEAHVWNQLILELMKAPYTRPGKVIRVIG